MNYNEFVSKKELLSDALGFTSDEKTYPELIKDHQRVSVTWACKRGCAALFLDTGLGKTLVQLTWADQIVNHTKQPVLILAPLAVSEQTVREGEKFGVKVSYAKDSDCITESGVYITNYQKIHKFDPSVFSGVVLDESSILKGMDGKLRMLITDSFKSTPYRLSCTATPSPNDFMELGTQSEFLGVMTQLEMLAMFFIHDGSDTSKWRLKGHAKNKFWEWLATWAIFMQSPADLGFDGSEYDLPEIEYKNYVYETEPVDSLFPDVAQGLMHRNKARRDTVQGRCALAAEIVNNLDEPAVVWCNLNDESALLTELIDGAVEVSGSDKNEHKAQAMMDFADSKIKALVTKPKIAGFGMNWQASRHCVFVGLSDSWEAFYQAIRRQWRFGQERKVYVHIVSSDIEGAVIENIKRKDKQHKQMSAAMMEYMGELLQKSVLGRVADKTEYNPSLEMEKPSWLTSESMQLVV